jgi:hypothetical protein
MGYSYLVGQVKVTEAPLLLPPLSLGKWSGPSVQEAPIECSMLNVAQGLQQGSQPNKTVAVHF